MALCGTAVFSGCGQEKNNEESSAVSSSEDETMLLDCGTEIVSE